MIGRCGGGVLDCANLGNDHELWGRRKMDPDVDVDLCLGGHGLLSLVAPHP